MYRQEYRPSVAGCRCRWWVRLPLSMTGVLSSLSEPLARAGISIFAISTFETDIILIRETDLEKARDALSRAGHVVE